MNNCFWNQFRDFQGLQTGDFQGIQTEFSFPNGFMHGKQPKSPISLGKLQKNVAEIAIAEGLFTLENCSERLIKDFQFVLSALARPEGVSAGRVACEMQSFLFTLLIFLEIWQLNWYDLNAGLADFLETHKKSRGMKPKEEPPKEECDCEVCRQEKEIQKQAAERRAGANPMPPTAGLEKLLQEASPQTILDICEVILRSCIKKENPNV